MVYNRFATFAARRHSWLVSISNELQNSAGNRPLAAT
jgi:hypothetical protein